SVSVATPRGRCLLSRSYYRHGFVLFFFLTTRRPPSSTLFPYTTLFRSHRVHRRRTHRRTGTAAPCVPRERRAAPAPVPANLPRRSEEHTSELQSQSNLVCRLLLEKKKKKTNKTIRNNNNKIYSTIYHII